MHGRWLRTEVSRRLTFSLTPAERYRGKHSHRPPLRATGTDIGTAPFPAVEPEPERTIPRPVLRVIRGGMAALFLVSSYGLSKLMHSVVLVSLITAVTALSGPTVQNWQQAVRPSFSVTIHHRRRRDIGDVMSRYVRDGDCDDGARRPSVCLGAA